MATGGRVLHHLKVFAPDPRNTILFAGFQAGGTRGDAMTRGAQSVKIHGAYVPIRAEVANLHMLSAHADADEIMAWLRNFRAAAEEDLRHPWRAGRRRRAAPPHRGRARLDLRGAGLSRRGGA